MADIKPIFDQPPETRPLPTPYQDVPYSPLGFGAGVGTGTQQVAEGLAEVYKKAKDSAGASAVIGEIGQARKALNDVILDPQQGYISTRGTDAIAQRDKYVGKFNDAIAAAASRLTNDDQKRAFAQHVQAIQEEGIRHVYSHEAVQQEDVERAAFAGTTDEARKSMQWAIDNPNDLKKQLDQLRTLATAEGIRRFGNSPAAIQAVVAPEMGKAAISTMEAALASQDPKMAQTAFDAVKPYFLSNHEHVYGNQVRALQTHVQIAAGARDVLKGGLDSVLLPGGSIALRPNAAKIDAGVANLSPDNPLRDQIAEEAQKRHNAFDKAWSQTVAQVYANALTSGTDKSGQFSIDRVPIGARTWLQQNASDKLIALRKEDARAQRADTGEDRQISRGNYSNLTAELVDPTLRKQKFGQMTPAEFQSYLRDEDRFPGGFTDQDTTRALQQFKSVKTAAGKLEEPIPSAVNEVLKAALPNSPLDRNKYTGSLHDALQGFVDDYQATHKGVAPSSKEVRDFGMKEMAQGKVDDTGVFSDRVRLLEFQANPKYEGKTFRPFDENAQPVIRPVRGTVPTVSTKAEYDALPSGSDYIDSRSGVRKRKG